ncbi:Predicted arabinose efflux permease, MFS family [Rhodococcus rhodochrous J3]|uniref:Predicted arabinose efflux permease, MFS family n=1 Tax=Rhodococcus rhodochrous J3 TaxID=903528 RepID=A0ABY1MDA6_RHORH|nr:MFS transporter [Rhodococcus rhodochrous]MBF4479383.1 MHS family MFS transporter [Rhodococcus rhodochrous]SMG36251.1 Predicted arabinose efflux permease, MFS family [Rhodococcus rhodochrous J3]
MAEIDRLEPVVGSHTPPLTERVGQIRRVAFSSLLGTVIEYYDFLLYSTMAALVFGELFFPNSNGAVSTIAAFGTLAAGYLARPLGGVLFGHFGDRLGRKSMLILSMSLMGGASFLIGVLPTYHTIGLAAPILLVALRVMQGIAVGGEWGGAALMVIEHAESDKRGRWAGIMQMGSPIGSLLSTLAVMGVTLLPDSSLMSWGWRVPFLISALLLAIGLYVRLSVVESPVFQKAVDTASVQKRDRIPALEILRRPRALLLATAVGIGPFVLTALINSHILAYAPSIGYDKADVVRTLLFMSCISLVCIPLFSALSDRIGRRVVSLGGAVGAIVFAFPLYAMVNTGSVAVMTIALMVAMVAQNALYAPLAPMLSEMFGTGVRYTGISMGYQLASLIGAGFTPMVAASLVAADNNSSRSLSLLMIGGAAITVIGLARLTESRGRDLTADITSSSV